MNQYETRKWMSNLPGELSIVPFGEEADITVINSCLVTKNAERDTRQMIHRAFKFSPNSKVITTGCYVDIHGEKTYETEENIIIVKRDEKNLIPKIISDLLKIEYGKSKQHSLPVWAPSSTRPPLLIQTGCNKKCAYCIIPFARGPSLSTNLEDILIEYKNLLKQNFGEIVLTGINLGSWGLDLKPKNSFSNLLSLLIQNTNNSSRIRIGSIEPEYVTPEVINLLENKAIAPHIHLPLQGTSDEILKAMGRPNKISQFKNLTTSLLKVRPDIAIGADIIAGFPGETQAEFEHGLELVKSLPLAYLHVFPFSSRPGTRAFKMKSLNPQIIKTRAAMLRETGYSLKTKYQNSFIGKTVKVIVERNKNGIYSGMSGHFFQVEFTSSKLLNLKDLVSVRLNDPSHGEFVENEK